MVAMEIQRQVSAQHDKVAINTDREFVEMVGNQAEMRREIEWLNQNNEALRKWIAGIGLIGTISMVTVHDICRR